MPRVNKSVPSRARRKKILERAKGFRGRTKNCPALAKQAVDRAGVYAYRDRKVNKRNMRSYWIIRLNAILRENYQINYSSFMNLIKKNPSALPLNRKILAHLATTNEPVFMNVITNFLKEVKI